MSELKYITDRLEVRKAFRNVFASPDGQIVMAELRAQFYDCPLGNANVNVVLQRVGSRDAIQYIIDQTREEDTE